VEAICCLKQKTGGFPQLSPLQVYDLISICDIAGKAIARLNVSINGAQKADRFQLAAQQQSLGSMFSKAMGSVAHDLRTPITVIRGFIKMILDGRAGAVSEAQRKCLEVAIESVNRLVEFSGTVGGAAVYLEQFQIEEFEILEAWTSVSSTIRPQLEEKSASVSEFIEPGMMVTGDRKLLFEVVERSILAMTAALQSGGCLRIEISRRSSGDVSFQVSLPEERDCVNPAAVVTQLQPVVLLHGGRLSYTVKPESGAVLNLILPGCAA
jgi:signal transduction histidine kinase